MRRRGKQRKGGPAQRDAIIKHETGMAFSKPKEIITEQ